MDQRKQAPSLLQLSLNRISVLLWNTDKIRSAVVVRKRCYPLVPLQHDLSQQVAQLAIPEELMERLRIVTLGTGLEIDNWMRYYDQILDTFLSYFYHHISWTVFGTVDSLKTARGLASSPMFKDNIRYKIACLYSQEDLIEIIWIEMDESYRRQLLQSAERLKCEQQTLVTFWTLYKFGDVTQIQCDGGHGPNANPFVCALQGARRARNKTSMAFFVRELRADEWRVAMFQLFAAGEVWTMEAFLKTASIAQRKYMFYSEFAYPTFVRWINEGSWKILELFAVGFIVDKEDLDQLIALLNDDDLKDDPWHNAQNVETWLVTIKPELIHKVATHIETYTPCLGI